METKRDIAKTKIIIEQMFGCYDEMDKHLKDKGDEEGKRIFGNLIGYTGLFIDDLFELCKGITDLKEEIECLKTKD